jgi:hypothetical protein
MLTGGGGCGWILAARGMNKSKDEPRDGVPTYRRAFLFIRVALATRNDAAALNRADAW